MTELIVAGGLIPSAWLASSEFSTALEQTALAKALSQRVWTLVEESTAPQQAVAVALGHEQFIQQHLGIAQIGQWYASRTASQVRNLPAKDWWRVDPVHLRLATDHVSLGCAAMEDIDAVQTEGLIEALHPLLDQAGGQMIAASHDQWLLHWPNLRDLQCTSSWAALGRSIDVYLPRNTAAHPDTDNARAWRRFCTEVEMSWFNHPVNQQRRQRGLLEVNSLWLQGPLVSAQPSSQSVNTLAVLESTYAARVLEQPYDWVMAIAQTPAAIVAQVEQSNDIHLTLGADAYYRCLRGTLPRWWQRASTNLWSHWVASHS